MPKHLCRQTRRLVLRPLEPRDYEFWREAELDAPPRRNRWDRGPRSAREATPAEFRSLLRRQATWRKSDSFYILGVFERATGALVGNVSVMNVMRGVTQSAFLGYSIHGAHWGKGYGREAVRALIDVAFRDLKLHRVEAGVEPGNRRSIRLARALGLRKEGLKRRAVYLRGGWVDLIMYGATCEEFGVRWRGRPRPLSAPLRRARP